MNKQELRNIIKEKNYKKLKGKNNGQLYQALLQILKEDLDHFDYEKIGEYEYLETIFDALGNTEKSIMVQQKFYDKLQEIRLTIKNLLVQKPGHIDKKNPNFRTLKNLIDHLETFSLSILYDCVEKYEGNKSELIRFIIFDVKNSRLTADALERFPHVVNFLETENKSLLEKVIESYFTALDEYTNGKKLTKIDDVLYFGEVMDNVFKNPELKLALGEQQRLMKRIQSVKQNLNSDLYTQETKEKAIFFLNDILYTISGQEKPNTPEYFSYKYDVKEQFDYAVQEESKLVYHGKKPNISPNMKRKIYTFDGKEAKEIDDALSVSYDNGIYYFGVHIADPSAFLSPNSIIYEEALRRTTSIYLSDRSIPMYPESLSSDIMSLNEGQVRPCRSYYFAIDAKTGEIGNSVFKKEAIVVSKNCTYHEFNTCMRHGSADDDLETTVENLCNVSQLLKKYYQLDELYAKLQKREKNISHTNITGKTPAESVIESAMVFTNHQVAKYFKDQGLPFVFRNHKINQDQQDRCVILREQMEHETNTKKYHRAINLVQNMYPQAIYEPTNRGHHGLGIKEYSHVTSPLRRSADNLANECLDAMYFKQASDREIKELERYITNQCMYINAKRPSVEKYSNAYENTKAIRKRK